MNNIQTNCPFSEGSMTWEEFDFSAGVAQDSPASSGGGGGGGPVNRITRGRGGATGTRLYTPQWD